MRLLSILCAIPLTFLAQAATAQCPFSKSSCAPANTATERVATAQCPFSKARISGNAPQKIELNMGYNAGIPLGEMGTHANTTHSLALRGFYLVPASHRRAGIGLEVTTGSYASFTRTQVFGMNGVETPTDVHYSSGVTTTSGVFRYDYLRTKSLIMFAALKGGFAGFTSRIMIEDPNDPDGCKALDDKNLISDYTGIAGVQTGANLDMQRFIKKLPPQTFVLQAYAGYLLGGNVDYINVKNITADDHASHNQTAAVPEEGRSLDVRFINLQTGAQHSHEVARVYNSPVRFLECGLSLVLRF